MNNSIWILSSYFKNFTLEKLLKYSVSVDSSGVELTDFIQNLNSIGTSISDFDIKSMKNLLSRFNQEVSISSYNNILGEPNNKQILNYLYDSIKLASMLGGDEQNIKVGTFVGFNKELGNQENGFQKNLDLYEKIFTPIIKYAENMGVTVLYENCSMEPWSKLNEMNTYNNLSACLAARKLMYTIIPSKSHGEIYDPSHDVGQNLNPIDVINHSDISRIHRIHVKDVLFLNKKINIEWGKFFPIQAVNPDLAKKAGIEQSNNRCKRYSYKFMLPNFNRQCLDWEPFISKLLDLGYSNPFVVEHESYYKNSDEDIKKDFKDTIHFLKTIIN